MTGHLFILSFYNRLGHKTDFNYHEWWKDHFDEEVELASDSEDDDFFWLQDRPRDYQAPKGRIVHFIPSEHMKILKGLLSGSIYPYSLD